LDQQLVEWLEPSDPTSGAHPGLGFGSGSGFPAQGSFAQSSSRAWWPALGDLGQCAAGPGFGLRR